MDAFMPAVDLAGLTGIVFAYDAEDDIALLHLNTPRPATTEHAGDGWYIRIAGGELVGLELHGVKRALLSQAFYLRVFGPAIAEMEALTGGSFDGAGITAEGSPVSLPVTTRLVMLLAGQALTKFETTRKAEMREAAQGVLAN